MALSVTIAMSSKAVRFLSNITSTPIPVPHTLPAIPRVNFPGQPLVRQTLTQDPKQRLTRRRLQLPQPPPPPFSPIPFPFHDPFILPPNKQNALPRKTT